MEPRIDNPAYRVPGAMLALQALAESVESANIPRRTLDLVHLRASQINGCGVCLHGGALGAKEAGETDERLFGLAGSPVFYGRRAGSPRTHRGRDPSQRPPASRAQRNLGRAGAHL